MTTDLDVFRSAKVLVNKHGTGAVLEAATRAQTMLNNGDLDGRWLWLRVMRAVEVLLQTRPGDGEKVH